MKALLAAVAVGAVGFTTAMAQGPVYSVNVVGFVNVQLVTGFNFLANPLAGTNQSINTIIPVAPDGATAATWNNATQSYSDSSTFLGAGVGWDLELNLPPGEGFYVAVEAPTTLTFVGEVMQGKLTNQIAGNFNLKGSQVPQTGMLTADLGFDAADSDVVYKWNSAPPQGFGDGYTYLGGGVWDPADPTINIAEGFFISRDPAAAIPANYWTRDFSVQ